MKITGKVIHGKALGRTVGMPTANIEPDEECTVPKEGVYATKICVREKWYVAVTNVGRRPSVDNNHESTIEAYILNFDLEIYGEVVELEFIEFLRPVIKFESLQGVREQVDKDIMRTKELIGE